MPNIMVDHDEKRTAIEAIWEWQRAQSQGQFGAAAVLPPEGTAPDGVRAVLYNIPDGAISHLHSKQISFEIAV
jgi:hypothetical protein